MCVRDWYYTILLECDVTRIRHGLVALELTHLHQFYLSSCRRLFLLRLLKYSLWAAVIRNIVLMCEIDYILTISLFGGPVTLLQYMRPLLLQNRLLLLRFVEVSLSVWQGAEGGCSIVQTSWVDRCRLLTDWWVVPCEWWHN